MTGPPEGQGPLYLSDLPDDGGGSRWDPYAVGRRAEQAADTVPLPPPTPLMAPPRTVPPRLGRYEVRGVLGSGAMGVVYRAHDPRLGRDVAIKALRRDPGQDEEQLRQRLERFRREGLGMARAGHANVVAVHEVGEHGGLPYLVMDLVDGESLEALLARGRLDPRRAAELARDVARGLGHAHALGVVHRDVKPANVLVERGGRALVADFGLARVEGAQRLSLTGQLVGTPVYFSPEQARGERAAVGPASDVFALGAVLYEALTGRVPFPAEDLLPLLAQIERDPPAPPRALEPRVPEELEAIVLRCLEKDPARRYADGGEVARALERFLEGPPPPDPRRGAGLLAAACAVALALLGVAALLALRPAPARREAAPSAPAPAPPPAPPPAAPPPRRAADVATALLARVERGELDAAARAAALQELQQLASPDVVTAVAGVLDGVSERLLDAEAAFVSDGAADAAGVASALHARRHAPPGRDPPWTVMAPLARDLAARGLLPGRRRDAHRVTVVPSVAAAQLERVGAGPLQAAQLACEALGRMGDDAAVPALGRHLRALADPVRAVPAGRALHRLGGGEALRLLRWGRARFGQTSPLAAALDELGGSRGLDPSEAAEPDDDDPRRSTPGVRRETPVGARGWKELGQDLADDGDLDAALRALDEAVRLDDELHGAFLSRARVHRRLGDLRAALADLDRTLVLKRLPAAHLERGLVRAELGQVEGALADLEAAGRRHLVPLAILRRRERDFVGALKALDRAVALDPGSAAPLFHRALVHLDRRDPAAAAADLASAVALDPEHVQAWRLLGRTRHELARLDEALAAHTRALELAPGSADGHVARARVHLDRRDPAAAEADLLEALRGDAACAVAWRLLGEVRRAGAARGDAAALRAALGHFDRAAQLDDLDVRALVGRGRTRRALGDLADAVADLSRALTLDPRDLDARGERGLARAALGEREPARADLELFLAQAPPDHPLRGEVQAALR